MGLEQKIKTEYFSILNPAKKKMNLFALNE